MENEELLETSVLDEVNTEENSIVDDTISSPVSEEAIDAVTSSTTSENIINDTTEIKVDVLSEEAKWYVLHTFSGYENVAKENLEIVKDK